MAMCSPLGRLHSFIPCVPGHALLPKESMLQNFVAFFLEMATIYRNRPRNMNTKEWFTP